MKYHGLAPLAGLSGDELVKTSRAVAQVHSSPTTSVLERSAAFLHHRGVLLGKYRSLYAFKAKFQPRWQARYLIVSDGQALPRILLALARAHGSGGWSMLKDMWVTMHPLNTMIESVRQRLPVH